MLPHVGLSREKRLNSSYNVLSYQTLSGMSQIVEQNEAKALETFLNIPQFWFVHHMVTKPEPFTECLRMIESLSSALPLHVITALPEADSLSSSRWRDAI